MVPASTAHFHQSSGSSSIIPPPPIPRPPPHSRPPSAGPMHPGQSMGGPYGHPAHRPQHNPGMPSFPPQSPNSRPMAPPSGAPPYHHLHSPPSQGRQPPHHLPPRGHMPHHPMPSHQPPQQYPPQHHPRPPQSGPPPPQQRPSSHARSSQNPKYPSSGLNGNWQSDKDMKYRRDMIQHIVKLLKQKDKNASQEWLNKLPQMVKQLEVSLYRSAPSFEAYADLSTLKHRLQQLAIEIARNTQPTKGEDREASRKSPHDRMVESRSKRHSRYGEPFFGGSSGGGDGNPPSSSNQDSSSQRNNDSESQQRIKHKAQRLLLLHHSSKCQAEEGRCTVTHFCADMKRLWKHMSMCKDTNCRVPHCYSSRSILSHYRKCKNQKCEVCGPVRQINRKQNSNNGKSSKTSYYDDRDKSGPNRHSQDNYHSRPSHNTADMPGHSSSASASGNYNSQRPPSQSSSMKPPYYGRERDQYDGRPGNSTGRLQGSHSPAFGLQNDREPPGPNSIDRNQHNNSPYSKSRSSNGTSSDRNDSEWASRIKHKQQRLLLLRHASKCTTVGPCKVTPHCANMKRIWKHISDCKESNCTFQHCMSSRYLLSHYRRCKETECPVCKPVRIVIDESRLREEEKKRKDHARNQQQEILPHYDRISQNTDLTGLEPTMISQGQSPMPGTSPEDCLSKQPPFYDHPRKKARPMEPNFDPSNRIQPPSDISQDPVDLSPPTARMNSPQSDLLKPAELPSPTPDISPPEDSRSVPSKCGIDRPPIVPSAPIPQPSPAPIPPLDNNISGAPTSPRQNHSGAIPPPITCVPVTSSSVLPKPNEEINNHSLINSFTVDQIETHIESLKVQLPLSQLKSRCLEVLKNLQTSQHGWVFNAPVDPVELNLPDYFDIIKKPMDLSTIQKSIETGSYHSLVDFCNDVRLVFHNAMTYNAEGSPVHLMAKELKMEFEADWTKLHIQLKTEAEQRRKNEKACNLCGCERLLFEPPVYFCNGTNCASQRIRRNSYYYVGGNNQYYWCSQCYNELDDKAKIEFVDLTLQKNDLKKKKNDDVHEESWVQCDTCERWIHQICGLFNSRQNKDQSEYSCPTCLLTKVKSGEKKSDRVLKAEDLPRTKLSEWLEEHVKIKVEDHKRKFEEEKLEEPASMLKDYQPVDSGGPITIRQVTSTDRKLEVRERMKKRYAHKNYPSEFPFRCKCIVVFQNLDGVDIILFALYVYEHGDDNPAPNKRTVYISYLDSVHFMRPRKLRTIVYHEILIAYLDYARRKGFETAHIWACPPLKGDDYIFYAKPEDQKTPKDSRLRQWYLDMLNQCKERNIVNGLTNMHDLYFSNEALDATAVPYLEGDYFPGEAENIIKDLEEGRNNKSGSNGKKSKKKKNNSSGNNENKKSKSKSKAGRKGTRSAGIEEEPEGSIISGTSKDLTVVKENPRDPVMEKLGEIISPMKESFIVAFLKSYDGGNSEPVKNEISGNGATMETDENNSPSAFPQPVTISSSFTSGRKRDKDGNARKMRSVSMAYREKMDKNGNLLKIIDDDSEELDCEFFNNRQAFLNLCRGNHYQFDEVRRAKHTSMMVLWHLHNRDAAKFVQQCFSCSREILSGKRYHCTVCTDVDLCEECFKNPKANRGNCTHTLRPMSVDGEPKGAKGGSGSQLTEAQRKERQRNIKLHIHLIEHASRCNSPNCASSNCAKMKKYLAHSSTCKLKASGGCKICKRIWTLLRIHAQQCKNNPCPIPQCMFFRERLRQLAKQQQAMDDRRREEMNRHYRLNAATG